MEDIVIIEPKDYSQVVFEDIQESYTQDVDMECLFSINELLKVDEADFVGIYKVGFKNSKEHISFVPVNISQLDETRKIKLRITADKLPKENGEFYQLVYVSQGKVRGASMPFQFKPSVEQEKLNTTFESEIEIINSKIRVIETEFASFENISDIYENCIEEAETIIKVILDTHNMMKDTREFSQSLEEIPTPKSESVEEIDEEEKSLKLKREGLLYSVYCASEKIEELKNELELMKKKKEDMEIVTDDVTSVLKFDNSLYDDITQISVYLEDRIEDMRVLIKKIEESIIRVLIIKNDVKENEMLIMDDLVGLPIEEQLPKLNITNKEKPLAQVSRSTLIGKYVETSKRLIESEETKKELIEKIEALTSELESVKSKMDLNKSEISKSEKSLLEENQKLAMEMRKLKLDYESRIEEANGSHFVLNVANTHLDSRIKTLEERYKKQIESQKSILETLKKENERYQDILKNKLVTFERYQEQKESDCVSTQDYSLDKDYFQILKRNDAQLEKLIQSSIDYNIMNTKPRSGEKAQLMTMDDEFETLKDDKPFEFGWDKPLVRPRSSIMKRSFEEEEKSFKISPTYYEVNNNNNEAQRDECISCLSESILPAGYISTMKCTCGAKCPVCLLKFPKEYTREHVDAHFQCHFAN